MHLKTIFAVFLTASAMLITSVSQAVTIEVGYPYSSLFDVTFKKIYPMFREAHPDIEVKFRATYDNYEDAANTILRERVSNKLPDVTFQGLNRQAMFVEKGIAKSLEPFIAKEANFAKDGYHKAMLDLGTFNGQVYGLPFSVSLPVGYYNMDAMNKAGIKKLPSTWDEVVDACDKLRAVGYDNPLFWGWNITGNWFFQALMWSQGEPIIKNGKVNFDGPAGLKALETGYMPPNKAANEMLGDFYRQNPNKHTAVRQAGLLREWIAYPGDNSLAITQVLYDGLESIVTGDSDDMAALQEELADEVSSMLPN